MTIQDYLRVLREQWLVLAVAVVLGLAGAGAVFVLRPAEYTATLTLYVSSQGGDSTSAAYQGAQLSQQRVASYVELVASRGVTEEVVRRLALPESPGALARRITASSALDSVLIEIAVVDTSPRQAARLADEVGRVFTALTAELERPVEVGVPPAVDVRVVRPAAVPDAPSTSGLPTLLALGLLAGLAVGVAAALLRHALDVSVKSPGQLHDAAGAPNLGTIALDPQVPKRPLTVHEEPQSPRAEAFRQLRTNLQFVDVDNPRKVVVVTSSLPAEGKTTTIANLGIALASAGARVLVVEADLRRPKLADLFGLERAVGLTSVLSGRVDVEQAVQPWSGGFDVLASGPLPPNPSELLASQQMRHIIDELRTRYDTVLIDTPPLLPVTDAAAVAPATDGVILVCRFKKTSRDQLRAAVQALAAVSTTVLGTVFTMVPTKGRRAYARYNAYYSGEQPGMPAAPVVPAGSATAGAPAAAAPAAPARAAPPT
ncbi:MAG: polysaccharide biosynthesis tyrosine autokinase [Pseudonocardia sp.]